MAGRKMRLGIIGLGVASTLALPEIARHPDILITAGADPRPAAREAFAAQFQARTYDSAEALCASPDVDSVTILTPNRMHAEHAILAAEHGKQVILDKPLALTLEDADRVIAAVDRNGVRLVVGHSQSMDGTIRYMADLVGSGQLGRPRTITTLFFSDWLYRPRSQDELDSGLGEGIVLRQGPVHADMVRMLGGGLVRSVRAVTSASDLRRPIDGGYTALAEFENGAAATMTYSGYGFFDSTELTFGVGLQGYANDPDAHRRTWQLFEGFASGEEAAYKEATRFGGERHSRPARAAPDGQRRHAFFGFTLVSCERGDIRQTPTGLAIYRADGRTEMPVPAGADYSRRYTTTELDLMYAAWSRGEPLASHDGRWARGTLEVCLAMLQSAREQREITLSHQVPYPARRAAVAETAT
jgi:phthalate 4,5-cis-dihydrodiol dehydrogenase